MRPCRREVRELRWMALLGIVMLGLAACARPPSSASPAHAVGEPSATAPPASTPSPVASTPTARPKPVDVPATVSADPAPATAPDASGMVAVIREGDVWLIPLDGGEPRRLTHDGRNSRPRWSPSRRWLAFTRDLELVTVDVESGDTYTLDGPVNRCAWSPVADRLACVLGSGILRLGVIDPDGTGETALVPPEIGATGALGQVAWHPDGTWIAYEWYEGREYHGLWKVPAEGGDPVETYAGGVPEQGEALIAGWTADGHHLLFWQSPVLSASAPVDGVPLYALPAEGGDPVRLADAVLYRPGFVVPHPTQAGRVALIEGAGRDTWTNKRLVAAGGAGQAQPLTPEDQAVLAPAWSPSGDRIAYSAMPDFAAAGEALGEGEWSCAAMPGAADCVETGGEGEPPMVAAMMQRRLWVAQADGTGARQLTDDPAYRDEHPVWTDDGTSLLFVRLDATGTASLWRIPATGGDPERVMDEIGPLPGPADAVFGYYGYNEWGTLFDAW